MGRVERVAVPPLVAAVLGGLVVLGNLARELLLVLTVDAG